MIILPDVNTSLEVVLAGAVATNQSYVDTSYHDSTSTTHTPTLQTATTNSTTAVATCGAPGASTERRIQTISMRNRDTAAITATFRVKISGTSYNLFKCTLQVGDMVQYEHLNGWSTLNGTGAVKEAAPLNGYRLMAPPFYNTQGGASPTIILNADAAAFEVELQASGGGGGGSGSGSGAFGNGGGGAGGYLQAFVPVAAGKKSITTSMPSGGAGSTTNGAGASDTTMVYNGVTYTAKGGSGAPAGATKTAGPGTAKAGAGGTVSTNADLNSAGMPGLRGFWGSSTAFLGGAGGSSRFSSGGAPRNTSGAGNTGSLGGGGSGGAGIGSLAGATGGSGFWGIRQYSIK